MQVDVVSVEGMIFSGEASFVVAPAEMGEVGVFPGHAPFITRLRSGSLRIRRADGGDEEVIYVSNGMLEVQPGSITVLSDLALPESELEEERLEEETRKVEVILKDRVTSIEYASIEAQLARAFHDLQGYIRSNRRKRKM